ncbi:galactose-3-O-sulfotransferase 2-like [Haliotis cracherodii]|uniref:galactose-3-O-sulfotransferase 2-like n=1 Tax=Haliotis cracherodii TaxID=6455 RepID=UPI0039E861B1
MASGWLCRRYLKAERFIFIAVALTELACILMLVRAFSNGFTRQEPAVEVFFPNAQINLSLRSASVRDRPITKHIPQQTDSDKTPLSGDTSPEVQHVFFLKVHKAASSTILNILYRFGYTRSKNFALPRKGNYIELVDHSNVLPIPPNNSYDILCNHLLVFSHAKISQIMPQDTVNIAIVREPFERLHSAFEYYRNQLSRGYLMKAKGDDPFRTYIQNPIFFEPPDAMKSFTNNRMALDFGYPPGNINGARTIHGFLDHLDSIFDLVLVSDVFDESVILLRRRMNWSMKDVLYMAKNRHGSSLNIPLRRYNRSVVDSNILRLDRIVYDHFLGKLEKEILNAGEIFKEEVAYFQIVRDRTLKYCSRIAPAENLKVQASKWHSGFEITNKDCWLLAQEENPFLELLRNVQKDKLENLGLHFQEPPKLYNAKKMKMFQKRA